MHSLFSRLASIRQIDPSAAASGSCGCEPGIRTSHQRETMTDADARRGMTEIMNSDVVKFSGSAQPFPRLRQVYERFLPGNRPLMMNPPVAASGRAERSRSTAKVGSLRKIGLEPVLLSGGTIHFRSQSTQSHRACNTSFTRAPVNNNSLIAAAA